MTCTNLWMKAGTHKKPKYIPVKEVIHARNLSIADVQLLLPFHAITGSDTTSFLSGHSKKTALKVFFQHKELLSGLGKAPLTEETIQNAETFICRLYKVSDVTTTDKARVTLFKRALRPELLPPSSDAVRNHIRRAHLQTLVWLQTTLQRPSLPPASEMGSELKDGSMSPVLLSLPTVPESCMQFVTCGCTTRCASQRCKCWKLELPYTGSCKCFADCLNDEY